MCQLPLQTANPNMYAVLSQVYFMCAFLHPMGMHDPVMQCDMQRMHATLQSDHTAAWAC